MQVNFLTYKQNNSVYRYPTFDGKGKPIDLTYIYQNRAYLLPERVKDAVRTVIEKHPIELPSLMEVHKALYAPLMCCKTLDEAKNIFPEFKNIQSVTLQRNAVYTKNNGTCADEDFALKMLQEIWAKLKNKDEVAQDIGLKGRQSLAWTLDKMNFVSYDKNYKTLLLSSDKIGNKTIADKTRAWNSANPELRRELNKHAAQGCKTPEYREAQSKRMFEYDKMHPQRKQKISEFDYKMWENCSTVREKMSAFAQEQPPYIRGIIKKNEQGVSLTSSERRIYKGFYKRFFESHPEARQELARAAEIARNNKQ